MLESRIRSLIEKHRDPGVTWIEAPPDAFWKGLRIIGTELWLDTGDVNAAAGLWNREFTGMTTNNSLLNTEVQKGMYDDVIKAAGTALTDLAPAERIIEIAFVLNALHGLKIVNRFGCRVSVELHTDCAHDLARTVMYAERFHRISPEHFIVKIPLTPTGIAAVRQVSAKGIPVNLTLGFSARQNYVAARAAQPAWTNVFLGRINAYIAGNKLGSGDLAGEKAAIASCRAMNRLSKENGIATRQIAASMRSADQIASLAGVHVFTIPVKAAAAAKEQLNGDWESALKNDYQVTLSPGIDRAAIGLDKLWDITPAEEALAADLAANPPADGAELSTRSAAAGLADLFPEVSDAEMHTITADGKIPVHAAWHGRISSSTLAIDSLLNLAALAAFTKDQEALDTRIRGIIG